MGGGGGLPSGSAWRQAAAEEGTPVCLSHVLLCFCCCFDFSAKNNKSTLFQVTAQGAPVIGVLMGVNEL